MSRVWMGAARKNRATVPAAVKPRASRQGMGASLISISLPAASPAKNARIGMGIKYRMLSRELTIRVATKSPCPASAAPRARNHLLQEPARGGRPMILIAPRPNAAKVTGMARPSPSNSLTWVLCAAT